MCWKTADVSVSLPMDLAAPGRARSLLDRAHCPEHHVRVLVRARLLAGELVTNAVRHAAPPIDVGLECCGAAGLRVRVVDADPDAPVVRDAGPTAEGGRGMALVDLLSDEWGGGARGGGQGGVVPHRPLTARPGWWHPARRRPQVARSANHTTFPSPCGHAPQESAQACRIASPRPPVLELGGSRCGPSGGRAGEPSWTST